MKASFVLTLLLKQFYSECHNYSVEIVNNNHPSLCSLQFKCLPPKTHPHHSKHMHESLDVTVTRPTLLHTTHTIPHNSTLLGTTHATTHKPHCSIQATLLHTTHAAPHNPHYSTRPTLLHTTHAAPYDPRCSTRPTLLHTTHTAPHDPRCSI